ncbi:DUF4189 domain-containing protein [Rhodobacter sp. NSM]|uniref:DUF4189 domain-containing protein n=1 Tax=Rhodobacter sp. NSM TaxID=3457501 RepID=UPI003FD3C7C5
MRLAIVAALSLVASGGASAGPVTGKEAKRMLFDPAGSEVEIVTADFLSEQDAALLRMAVSEQPYYGAIAVSPDEGLASEATIAAANHHTTEAAKRAALEACEAKRKGRRACEIVGLVRPKGWKDRGFSLSSEATKALNGGQSRGHGRALAISPATGHWGLGSGAGAQAKALRDCAEEAGASDCILVVAD